MLFSLRRTILITGGLGYIGVHIVLKLMQCNYKIIIVDNLSNSKLEKMNIIYKLINYNLKNHDIQCVTCCSSDKTSMYNIFEKNDIDIVIHLASFTSINESLNEPLKYYENNVCNTIELLNIMKKYNCYNLIFSSCCSLYESDNTNTCEENIDANKITNPYTYTKYIQEKIFTDLCNSDKKWTIFCLRYFNIIGYTNYVLKDNSISLMNNLYENYDGKTNNVEINLYKNNKTDVKDYLHVEDLSEAHLCICSYISNAHIVKLEEGIELCGIHIFNVGSGKGISDNDFITTFEVVNNFKVNKKYKKQNEKKSPHVVIADVSKIYDILGWEAKYTLEEMVKV